MKFFKKLSVRLFLLLILSNTLLAWGLIQITSLTLSLKNNTGKLLTQGRVRPPKLHHFLDDLGDPPNLEAAERVAKKRNMEIMIVDRGMERVTDNHLPSFNELSKYYFKDGQKFFPDHSDNRPPPGRDHRGNRPPPPPRFGHGGPPPHHGDPGPPKIREAGVYKDQIFQVMDFKGVTLVLFFKDDISSFLTEKEKVRLAVMIGAIILSVLFSLWLVSQMLLPLKSFIRGVRRVGAGRFETQLPDYSTEEFNILSTEFNNMVKKVDRMVQGRDYLLRAVNHELRGPMSRLKIQAEMVDDEKIRQSISEDLVELEEMMENLLEVERVQSGADTKKHPFNLSELVEQIHNKFKTEGKNFSLDIENEEIFLTADPIRIKILLKNLIENSFKYAEGKGLSLKVKTKSKKVLLTVSDEGPGINPLDQQHIFDAFYRSDKVRTSKKDGLGLGLHLCQEIARNHGGEITLISNLGKGSTFEVSLPLS